MADYLLEIRCEEIPATMVARAVEDLGSRLAEALTEHDLGGDGWRGLGGPRRIAVVITGLRSRQDDRTDERVGPPVDRAFDDDGKPTKAALGFARKQGIEVDELVTVETARGKFVAARVDVEGRAASAVLADIVPKLALSLSFRKTMRWGAGEVRFVRAIRSVISLLDAEIVPLSIAGIAAGRTTVGHRFHGNLVELATVSDYQGALEEQNVIVDASRRRQMITDGLVARAAEVDGKAETDEALLEELVYMSEKPEVIRGTYDSDYLELPAEVLVTSIKHHQKSFPIWDVQGEKLLPGFLAVSNVPDVAGHVVRGAERVLHARLSDARFFWNEDRKRSLENRVPELERMIFQEKLGSYDSKRIRVERLVIHVLEYLGIDPNQKEFAVKAARLAKVDLLTDMVGEFPELQGRMGGLYATAEGSPEPVARAVYEQYQPNSLDDPPPSTPLGAVLSIADKVDTLVGCFGVGLAPTGTRDPLGLRRAAQGVVRTVIQTGAEGDLTALLDHAAALHRDTPGATTAEEGLPKLRDYLQDRIEHVLRETGAAADTVLAILARDPLDPVNAMERTRALTEARQTADFEQTFTVFKRVQNIAGDEGSIEHQARDDRPPEETNLAKVLAGVEERVGVALRTRDYRAALDCMRALAEPLHQFFDKVLVMDEDPAIRDNRLALLRSIGRLARVFGDFSKLQVERQKGTT